MCFTVNVFENKNSWIFCPACHWKPILFFIIYTPSVAVHLNPCLIYCSTPLHPQLHTIFFKICLVIVLVIALLVILFSLIICTFTGSALFPWGGGRGLGCWINKCMDGCIEFAQNRTIHKKVFDKSHLDWRWINV